MYLLILLVTALIVVSGAEAHWWTSVCEDADRLHDHSPAGSAARTGGHACAREGSRSHTQGGLEVGCVRACVRACVHMCACTFLSRVFGVCVVDGWAGGSNTFTIVCECVHVRDATMCMFVCCDSVIFSLFENYSRVAKCFKASVSVVKYRRRRWGGERDTVEDL